MNRSSSVSEVAQALEVLVAIADFGSFTAAGERLGLTPSAVSKAVARTEMRLGVQLLVRTTRRVALTDRGEVYVANGRRVLAELAGVDREASSREGKVRGIVRIAAPVVYGALKVAPLVAAFQRTHPELDVQLRCDDRIIDMVAERIDVAVRMLAKPPAELVARVMADDRRSLYASPSYLRKARVPHHVEDLASHSSISYSGASQSWRRGRVVFATDSVLAAREAARAGLGIVELPDYLAEADVAAGHLREVLPGSVLVTRKIFVLYLPSRFLSSQVRACVDLLVG